MKGICSKLGDETPNATRAKEEPMTDLESFVNSLDEYLDVASIRDYAPIGLQVEGGKEVGKVVTGVSACMELFKRARDKGADTILVHHGMFWDSDPRVVRGSLKERLKFLLENEITLIAYHLPLDRHPEVGNNIQLIKRLGLTDPQPFGEYKGKTISYMAGPAAPEPVSDFMARVREVVNPEARIHAFGPDTIGKVAVCTGGAPELVREAALRKADLYLTGEDSEWIYHLSREEGIHYVAAGHHATEKFGLFALGDHIREKFGLDVEFVDIYNPI